MGYHTKFLTPTKCLSGAQLKAFIDQHSVKQRVRHTVHTYEGHHIVVGQPGFYKVTHQMHVFKKIRVLNARNRYVQAIANLIIPVGATIYTDPQAFCRPRAEAHARKMRASEAYVDSIVQMSDLCEHQCGLSGHNPGFMYSVGSTVVPVRKFAKHSSQCASGIHFFINLADAMEWQV